MDRIEQAASAAVDAAIEVHRHLGGAGLSENLYEAALEYELKRRGHNVERQVRLPVYYKGTRICGDLVVDMVVDRCLLLELKATSEHHEQHRAQLLTYLRLSNFTLGLLLNFGMSRMKSGIQRLTNNHPVKYE